MTIHRSTQLLSRALDILLANSPRRTGLGVAIGLVLYSATLVLQGPLKAVTSVDLTQAPFWGWVALGVVSMHVRAIFSSLKEDSVGNDQIDAAIKVIRQANFSASEQRQQYRLLIGKVIDGLEIRPKENLEQRSDPRTG
jgi:hypothetical protein